MAGPSEKPPLNDSSSSTISLPEYALLPEDNVLPTSSSLSDSLRRESLVFLDDPFDTILPAEDNGRVALTVGKNISKVYNHLRKNFQDLDPPCEVRSEVPDYALETPHPSLNIVLQVVGSRGDVQPFLALAQALQKVGHRIRLATHPVFRDLVESHGVEFFSIGGDPAELMSYMVKNPGLIPRFAAIKQGEIYRRRRAIRGMLRGCWKSCFEPTDGCSPINGSSIVPAKKAKRPSARAAEPRPFVADAIIANPPSFAHIHCAEKLGIPVHMVFTMPWSPTREFAHPLADIKSSDTDVALVHYLSYFLVDAIIWQGLGSVINRFRSKVLGLQVVDPSLAPGMNFISSGPPPIFVGFGSIVTDDPTYLTSIVLRAIELSGVRAIISGGWGSLDVDALAADSNKGTVFFLQSECPHDYLFQHVSLVVHHGGAGTTAAGLAAGRPTIVVPFFGDQFFWGHMVHRAGVGPAPIHNQSLTPSDLVLAIRSALEPAMKHRAVEFGKKIRSENGLDMAICAFHAHLPRTGIPPCSLFPDRVATLQFTGKSKAGTRSEPMGVKEVHLSPLAATFLRKHNFISSSSFENMQLLRYMEYNVASGPYEPVSGAAWTILDLFYETFKGMGEILTEVGHLPYLGVKAFDKGKAAIRSPPLPPVGARSSPSVTFSSSSHHSYPGSFMLKGTLRVSKAAARAPGAFATALASGAHNLPRLYHDPTVRPIPRITGINSGFKAGVAELGFGIYDGIAGVFTQPIMGAIDPHQSQYGQKMEERRDTPCQQTTKGDQLGAAQETPPWTIGASALGFAKGLGRGAVGLPIKFFAAASGIAGYPLKGIDSELSKAWKGDDMKEVRKQRNLQGEKEYFEAGFTSRQVEEIAARWEAIMGDFVR
ncbi:uncharacterized protein A1O9_01737 [Exophiala aquamarina CBS 119918]|uniref:Uncharacterized protein n=1 Tax=Exophiala aquamarina CBS 119918 TaxID=1182545 RepID=A0A072PUM5_9EURO|nr:uncharacterized protein A1O9_01737 [Exophiala aquamarina CBS 119918]KEF63759.1 hypothetical protein A1O9_01737 [Exophiala aquamarina CBS 119918]